MRALVDSNVLLDFLATREPFYEAARELLVFAAAGDYELWMSPSQVTDLFYVLSGGGRAARAPAAREALLGLRRVVHVCPLGEEEVDRALESGWDDFEDSLVHQAALAVGARAIVTRNARDFARSSVPALPPDEFRAWARRRAHVEYDGEQGTGASGPA